MDVPQWLEMLDEEDLAFIRRLVLASGSLKAVAEEYGISYPTVRLRLDRLIAKIRMAEASQDVSEFERILRVAFADGKIDMETMKTLMAAHKKETRREP
jgi:hypothetical protein